LPGLEILAYEDTPLGPLCLRRRIRPGGGNESVTEITLDHEFLMSSLHTASERALARTAIDMHGGRDLRVLIGGLGLGYTAAAVLESDRVRAAEVVELLPPVIAWMRAGLVPLSPTLAGDPRLTLTEGDVYARLAKPGAAGFDLVLIDVDHSPDDRLDHGPGLFYTPGGLTRAKSHLAAGGVLGVWSYAESSPFADALRGVFEEVRVEAVRFTNAHLGEPQTDWLFFARG
jgi:spermidine synthase